MRTSNTAHRSRALVIMAFGIVYVLWGSTYLRIRVAVETLPPFLFAGARFVVAGSALLALLLLRKVLLPTAAQWRHAFIVGGLLLVGGNELVVFGERSISSALSALLIALTPVWFALLDWARPNGARPGWRTLVGIVVGFAGIALLVNGHASVNGSLIAAIGVIVASICWAVGSLYSKHVPNTASPWMNAATQMLCGGIGLSVIGIIHGEPWRADWAAVSARSSWACIPNRFRIVDRVQCLCLASASEHAEPRVNLRVRESCHRGIPWVGAARRSRHQPHVSWHVRRRRRCDYHYSPASQGHPQARRRPSSDARNSAGARGHRMSSEKI